jgi:hypothetical protein
MRQFKHYELRSAPRPNGRIALCQTVSVVNADRKSGYAYVSFSDSFVAAVGRVLPRGVSVRDPAYLHVYWSRTARLWKVTVKYFGHEGDYLLWESPTQPSWLNVVYPKGQHANPNDSTSPPEAHDDRSPAC